MLQSPSHRSLVGLLLLSLVATALSAQRPVANPTVTPLLEQLTSSAEQSRWLWGTFRVQPALGIGGINYVDNVFADNDSELAGGQAVQSDINATAFAGLNLYQLLGDRVAFGIFARGQYAWWQDLEERRRFNPQAGAAAAVQLNRFFLNGEARRIDQQGIATEEVEQLINYRTSIVDIALGFEVYRSLAVTAGYEVRNSEHLLDESPDAQVPAFQTLDREIETQSLGVRVAPGRNTEVSLSYVEQDYRSDNSLRNYDGSGPALRVTVDGVNLNVSARFQQLELEPTGTSSFEPFDDVTGSLFLTLGGQNRASVTLFGEHLLSASVRQAGGDFEFTRIGVLSRTQLSERTALTVGYNEGEREFRTVQQTDDIQQLSAGLSLALWQRAAINARYQRVNTDSSVAGLDRDINRFTIGFSIGIEGLAWP